MQRPTADPTLKERLATRIKLRSLIRTLILIGFFGGVVAAGIALYPSVVGLNVGSGGVTESTTSAGPTLSLTAAMVGTGPYYLNQTGATYVLAENITTRGTALVFAAQNVILDLNGKTITFNTDGNINRYGVALPPPYAHSNGKWSLSDITTWQASTGSTVKNGSIVQGGTTSANCQSSISNSPFCAAFISNDESSITVQNLNITVSVGDTFAMYFEGGGNFTVSGNTINDNTTAVINRSQGRAAIDFFEPSGTQGLEVFNNTINNARQWGIRVSRSNTATTWAHIYNNQIFPNTIVTNGYGLGAHGGSLEMYGNTVHATNGRGIHIENNNIKVYNNDIDVVELPSPEYPRVSAHGIKVEYGSGIEIYGNTVVSKGLVITDPANPSGALASNGSALNFSVDAGSSTYVHNNTFIARHLGGPAFDPGVYAHFATAIEGVEQWHETGNMGLRIENNTFISNDRFFTLTEWVPPGGDYANPVDVVGFSIKGNTFTREATTVPTAKKDVFFTQAASRGFRFIDNNGGDFRYVGTGWPWALNVYSVGYTGNVTARNSDGSPAVGVTIQAKDAQNVVTSATTNAQGVATFVLDAFTASVTNSAQFVEKNPYQITALFPSGSKSQQVTINSAGWQVTLQTAAAVDTTAPAVIANLAAGSPTSSSIGLSWTAPGDDGAIGTATAYDMRYSTSAITAANYASAIQATSEPAPAAAGTSQSMTVSGLNPVTTYYFALKTSDEVLNTSVISNVISRITVTVAPRGLQIVVSSRTGTSARVRTFDATGKQLAEFSSFGTTFSGGLSVATGDTTGDGVDEIITAQQGKDGSGEVMISSGTGEKIISFAAFPAGQGVNVSSADIDGDGQAEIVAARESGGEPVVKVFTPAGTLLREFMVFNKSFHGGVNVTSGDLTGDGKDDLAVAPARSAKALIRILDLSTTPVRLVKEFVAGAALHLQGTAVSVGNFGGEGLRIFTSPTEGGQKPGVKIYDAQGKDVGTVSVASDKFRGGVSIAAGDLVGNDNKAELTTVTYSGGTPNIFLFQDIEHPAAIQRSASIPAFSGLDVTGANIVLGHLTP